MPSDKDTPATMSIPEAARFAGVGIPVIKAAIEEGQIPVRRIGKRVRVLRVPFEAWLMTDKPIDGETELPG
jgi:excisionase family DNA binding protein